VNPFPEGISLWKKTHDLGVHFSYSDRLDNLHQFCATVKYAAIKVQLDLNDTHVTAQHDLFLSYAGENAADIEMTKDEFKDLIVQEAVLDTMRLTTVLPQYETNCLEGMTFDRID
jgi:hypothetical protein